MKAKLIFLFFLLITLGTRSQNLIDAIRKGDIDQAKALATPEQINMTDENGATPLMWAVYKGDLEFVKFLHENGARTDQKGIIYLEDGSYYGNLTGIAAGENKLDVLKYLIDECRIDVDDKELNPENGKEEGWTALHWGVSRGNIEVTLYLLKNGADVNAGERYGAQTPLIVAVDLNNNKILEILLKNNANVNYAGGNQKMTATHYAAWNNDTVALNFLYKYGADVNKGEIDGWTPLHIAAVQRNEEAYLWLMDHGGDNTVKNSDGKSPASYYLEYKESLDYLAKTVIKYLNCEYYDSAMIYSEKGLRQSKGTIDEQFFLFSIAEVYAFKPQYDSAIVYYNLALSNITTIDQGNIELVTHLVINLVKIYLITNQKQFALNVGLKYLKDIESKIGKNNLYYATVLQNVGAIYVSYSDYVVAFKKYEEAKLIYENHIGDDSYNYNILLTKIGQLYYSINLFAEAQKYFDRATDYFIENKIRDRNYFLTRNALSLIKLSTGCCKEEILKDYLDFKNYLEDRNDTISNEYAANLNNIALIYQDNEDIDRAIEFYNRSLVLLTNKMNNGNFGISVLNSNLGSIYYDIGDLDMSEQYYKTSNEIIDGNVIEGNALKGSNYKRLNQIYFQQREYELLEKGIRESIKNMQELITVNSILPEMHRSLYKDQVSFSVLQDFYPSMLYNLFNDGFFMEDLMYDLQLASKNYLIVTTRIIRSAIENTDNKEIKINRDTWLSMKSIINGLEMTNDKEFSVVDSLNRRLNELELNILYSLDSITNEFDELYSVTNDIKKNLKEQEIAIEFSSFPYHNGQRWTDSTYYVALVLGKDYKHPKMIKLFEERELRALMPDATQSSSQDFNLAYQGSRGSGVAYYGQSNSTGDQLYELIWKPLDSLMEGINTVYYANSGLLHKVNLAAMPAPDGKLLLEKFQLNQLSSTRNLVLKEEEKPMSNAVVYGGIHYDMQQDQLANAVASVSTDTLGYDWLGATISYPELRGYAGKYGGFNYLPGSLYEAQQVAYHLEDAMETRLITGDKAVEESFTQLSGNSSPSVIHIATHGFYFPDTITQVTDRDMLLMGAMGEERFRIYDDPLLRSALVMAGANRSWLGEELPPGAEDGILTAKDVSAMNLSNTELVVLSACQTGLGEVDGTEGVTGLQRGFKMAGVKYVMMSLWPVPDKETAEFMETFYSYWDEGIREAFHKTQQFMANKYRNEPYKWAGFVLVE